MNEHYYSYERKQTYYPYKDKAKTLTKYGVTFKDGEIRISVEVQASSLGEAVHLAHAKLKAHGYNANDLGYDKCVPLA